MIQRLRETSVLRLLQAEAGGSGWDFVARVYLSWLREHPARLPELAGLVLAMARADRRRERQASAHGIPIPINLVVSPTSDCNMDCPACGTLSRRSPDRSLSPGGMANILKQCRELGICRLTLVGGEPLMYEHLEPLLGDHPDLHFTVFTNGRLMDDRRARGFAGLNNVTFMINAGATNSAESATRLEPCLLQAMEQMKRHGLLFGYAVTTTALNHRLFAARATILRLHSLGARVGFFFDYLPGLERDSATDDPLLLGRGERRRLVREVRTLCRQSVCATRDLDAGHVLTDGDLTVKRPGTGIPAAQLDHVLGQRLARPVHANDLLRVADLA